MNNARAFRGFRFPAEVILWPDTLGVPTEQISIRWGDTNLLMIGPVYGGSHTMGAGSAVKLAAEDARRKLAVYVAAPEEPLDLATLMARANVEEVIGDGRLALPGDVSASFNGAGLVDAWQAAELPALAGLPCAWQAS
jgi:CO/xanthine dehydrogenase Mo-binding subunit